MAAQHSKRRANETIPLTKRIIEDLEPGSRIRTFHDARQAHLQLLVHPTGRKTWQVVKSFKARPVFIKLGEWPLLDPAGARKAAQTVFLELANGINRNEVAKAQANATPSLGEALEAYLLVKDLGAVYRSRVQGGAHAALRSVPPAPADRPLSRGGADRLHQSRDRECQQR